jgi:Flp pilus assembly pilin Flp
MAPARNIRYKVRLGADAIYAVQSRALTVILLVPEVAEIALVPGARVDAAASKYICQKRTEIEMIKPIIAFKNAMSAALSERKGVTALEYGVIAAVTVVAVAAAIAPVGVALGAEFTAIAAAL